MLVTERLEYPTRSFSLLLELVEMLGEQVADRVRGLENSSGNTPLAENTPSNICTRCSKCSAREDHSPIPHSTLRGTYLWRS